MQKKNNIFELKKNWLRNSLKVTAIFLLAEIIAHWLVANHMAKGHVGHMPYAHGSGGDFTINNWILYGVLPILWIFLVLAARAYGIEKRDNAIKRIKADFPFAKELIDKQRFKEFDDWFETNKIQMRSWEKKRILDFRNFSSSNLDK